MAVRTSRQKHVILLHAQAERACYLVNCDLLAVVGLQAGANDEQYQDDTAKASESTKKNWQSLDLLERAMKVDTDSWSQKPIQKIIAKI